MPRLATKTRLAFDQLCVAAGLPRPVAEYRFCERRWRFDWAWPNQIKLNNGTLTLDPGGVAVEIEGGVWSRGRHTRGSGYLKDLEKYNRATAMGWRLFRYTPQQIQSGEWVETIREALQEPTR